MPSKRTTSTFLGAVFTLVAAAFAAAHVATLPPDCGAGGNNDRLTALNIAAGVSLATAVVLYRVGKRTSIWPWVAAVACGAAISGLLLLLDLISWAEACTS